MMREGRAPATMATGSGVELRIGGRVQIDAIGRD
jgi:hypothetical protein